jgi:HPt (histidine-containing phosphotransfer) domain-containing protein
VADGQRVNRAAHALKGASGELGAARLRALSSRLELQTANQSVEGLDGLIGIVEEEANRVRVALEAQKVAAVAARVQNTATG